VKSSLVFLVAPALLLGGAASVAHADLFVYTGYADNLRPSPFFPSPFYGDPSVINPAGALGNTATMGGGAVYDSGAIRILNTGNTAVTITDVNVTFNGGGIASRGNFDLWGNGSNFVATIGPNQNLVLTQTNGENFDTSDLSALTGVGNPVPNGFPGYARIFVTIGGVINPVEFDDTAHVLDTGGFDLVNLPPDAGSHNESLQWRPIGTTGVSDPGGNPLPPTTTGRAPEPSTLALLGLGTLGLLGYWRRRRGPARA
jgi:hypothetical protein